MCINIYVKTAIVYLLIVKVYKIISQIFSFTFIYKVSINNEKVSLFFF